MKIEFQAIQYVTDYFKSEGYDVEDVSRKSGHNGYDLFISQGADKRKIEVKGCSREWQIPDLFSTEFDQDRRLIADELCVVYFIEDRKPVICRIPRDAIQPEDVVPKMGYRIRSRLKKKVFLEKYVHHFSQLKAEGQNRV